MTKTITPLEFLKKEMETAFAGEGYELTFHIDRQCVVVKEAPVDDEGWPPYSKSLVMPDGVAIGFMYPVSPAVADIINTIFETKYLHPAGVGMGFAIAYNEYTKKCLCGGDYVPEFSDETWDEIKKIAEVLDITPAQIIERSTLRTIKQFKESGTIDDAPSTEEPHVVFERLVKVELGEGFHLWQVRGDTVDSLLVARPEAKAMFDMIKEGIKDYASSEDAVDYQLNELLKDKNEKELEGVAFLRFAKDQSWFESADCHKDIIGNIKSYICPV